MREKKISSSSFPHLLFSRPNHKRNFSRQDAKAQRIRGQDNDFHPPFSGIHENTFAPWLAT
jgi:hypothetical protein